MKTIRFLWGDWRAVRYLVRQIDWFVAYGYTLAFVAFTYGCFLLFVIYANA